jgi:hypothetical protein
MHARVSDHLDAIAANNPDGFDIGVAAIVVEVLTQVADDPDFPETRALRVEGDYTPAQGTDAHFAFYCSDSRRWVKRAVHQAAYEFFEYRASDSEDEVSEDEFDA